MTIAIIDDHVLVADSIKVFLGSQPGIISVTTYTSAKLFLEEYTNGVANPDLVITDLIMPEMDGMVFLSHFQKTNKGKIKVIALSSVTDTQVIKQIVRSGVNGFLSKSSPTEELLSAIEEVQAGKLYISKNLRNTLLNNMLTEEKVIFHLSPREKEVLHKVCSGRTIKEIAFELNLSKHTVQSYHQLVMSKLKVKRSADLIVFAMQHGLYIPDTSKSL